MNDHRFPKSVRVRKQADFDRVYQAKSFAADDVLVIKTARNELGITRLGLSISRKVGNAVVRNRWKRAIREAFRRQRFSLPSGIDLVIRPRKGADCDHNAIVRSIGRLVDRLEKNLPQTPTARDSQSSHPS